MNLYLISQCRNSDYDTYDSAVVAAKDEDSARMIHPDGRDLEKSKRYPAWCSPEHVEVELIGVSNEDHECVICSSFNAG